MRLSVNPTSPFITFAPAGSSEVLEKGREPAAIEWLVPELGLCRIVILQIVARHSEMKELTAAGAIEKLLFKPANLHNL